MQNSLLAMLFGDDMMRSDMMNQPADVSQMSTALKGPGGPKDDLIPAVIEPEDAGGAPTPARLSPGEFVLSQPVVAALGGGNEDLGAGLLDILQTNQDALTEVQAILAKYAS